MNRKIDRKALLSQSLRAEQKKVDDRFARADAIQEAGGLLRATPGARAGVIVSPSPPPAGGGSTDGGPDGATFSAESPAPTDRPARVLALQAEGRSVVALPLEQLVDNPFNARQIYDPEVVRERSLSLAAHGQRVPAIVARDWRSAGQFVLIDGHYRKRALKEAGRATMDCLVDDSVSSDLDLYRVSYLANEERNAQSALDNALAWRVLLERGVVEKEEDLCSITNMSWANVNKTMALAKISAEVRERMRASPGVFGIALGYEVFLYEKALGSGEAARLVDRVITERLSAREVERARKMLVASPVPRTRETSRQWKLRESDAQVGTLKVRDSGRVLLDVTVLDPARRHELVEEIKRRFGVTD